MEASRIADLMKKAFIEKTHLRALINDGLSAPQIAKRLQISHVTILKHAESYGLKHALIDNGRHNIRKLKLNVSKSELAALITNGNSAAQIAERYRVTYPTIIKLARRFGVGEKLLENGKRRQALSNFKDGRGIYRKYKKDHCEVCLVRSELHVHHKKPAQYKNSNIVAGDHSPENLITVCNSCHQKIHYRELNRTRMLSDGKRFFSAH